MTDYEFGDVVLVEFIISGSNQRKKRPALVVLDTGDQDIVLSPITTHQRNGQGDLQLVDWRKSGLLRESWVRLAKIASLTKSDIKHRLGKLADNDKKEVIQTWQKLYNF